MNYHQSQIDFNPQQRTKSNAVNVIN